MALEAKQNTAAPKTLKKGTEFRQCKAIRTVAGHVFQCRAEARFGEFCGYHKPRELKQRSKGCTVLNRDGIECKARVLADGLCPAHWQKAFGHEYVAEGSLFRCRLCNESLESWAVGQRGGRRARGIKRRIKCPAKMQESNSSKTKNSIS